MNRSYKFVTSVTETRLNVFDTASQILNICKNIESNKAL